MIPSDIETTVQWRVRHQTPDGSRELTRSGTELQVRSIAARMDGVVEKRVIEVGPWVDGDTVLKDPEEDVDAGD